MSMNRRGFLRLSLTVLGTAAGGEACRRAMAAEPSTTTASGLPALTADHQLVNFAPAKAFTMAEKSFREGFPGKRFVMVFDLAKCDGCGACTKACGKMHFIPNDRQWIKVLRMQDAEATAPYFMPQPCFHCDNPPCTKVCPVDATFKRQDGVVLIDNERCIGCRFCMAACPYGARSFNWTHPNDPPEALLQPYSPEQGFPRRVGTVEKCDFCADHAAMGMLPACTAGCPMGAIYYGDEIEDAVTNSQGETLQFSKLLLDRSGYRQLEELGTKPRVYYLPPKNRAFPAPGSAPAATPASGTGSKA
jgi:molybdopterin-containing oxidoreductase family iron-sulfur binding subunit